MKLLLLVAEHGMADTLTDGLIEQGFRVTRLATTGGFLRRGNVTLMVGTDDHLVEDVFEISRRLAPGTLSISLNLDRYEHF